MAAAQAYQQTSHNPTHATKSKQKVWARVSEEMHLNGLQSEWSFLFDIIKGFSIINNYISNVSVHQVKP